jgi:hypothetical protein
MKKNETDFVQEWDRLIYYFIKTTGKKPNLNTFLFLIGVNELGKGKLNYSKEEKQDLMHIAVCKLFSQSHYYKLDGLDKDGWPHYTLIHPLPSFNLEEQELALQKEILVYFHDILEEEKSKNIKNTPPPNHLKL